MMAQPETNGDKSGGRFRRMAIVVAAVLVVGILARFANLPGGWASVLAAAALGGIIAAIVYGGAMAGDRIGAAGAADGEDEARRRQRARSIGIALALGGLVLLFYIATIVRLGGNVFNRPM